MVSGGVEKGGWGRCHIRQRNGVSLSRFVETTLVMFLGVPSYLAAFKINVFGFSLETLLTLVLLVSKFCNKRFRPARAFVFDICKKYNLL